MPWAPNHWGAPENPINVASTFFNTVHLLPKCRKSEHGSIRFVSCPVHHLNAVSPWAREVTETLTKPSSLVSVNEVLQCSKIATRAINLQSMTWYLRTGKEQPLQPQQTKTTERRKRLTKQQTCLVDRKVQVVSQTWLILVRSKSRQWNLRESPKLPHMLLCIWNNLNLTASGIESLLTNEMFAVIVVFHHSHFVFQSGTWSSVVIELKIQHPWFDHSSKTRKVLLIYFSDFDFFAVSYSKTHHHSLVQVKSRNLRLNFHCLSQGSQPLDEHAPLEHFDRWACTPKISYDKKAEQNNKTPLKF